MNSFTYCVILLPRYCELCGCRFWFTGYQSDLDPDRWRCPECQRRVMWGRVIYDLNRKEVQ
jgi:hypothetical protein